MRKAIQHASVGEGDLEGLAVSDDRTDTNPSLDIGSDVKALILQRVVSLLRELGIEVPSSTSTAITKDPPKPKANALTVAALCDSYIEFAKSYYLKRGVGVPHEATVIEYALRPIRAEFGNSLASEFGPKSLKAVRSRMIELGWCRGHINMQIGRTKRMFKWAVSNEMLPSSVFHALQSVDGLKAGRTTATEAKPIKPVDIARVEAIFPFVTSPIKAMIQLQLLTGMRPGEVTIMRACDIDRTGDPWIFHPSHHKTEQHGIDRVILLGPKCQSILIPFINDSPDPQQFLFSPIRAERERRKKLQSLRKTPLSCGNVPGSHRVGRPRRKPGDGYDTRAYGHAIRYGCRAAFPAPNGFSEVDKRQWFREHNWHPHQLRHNVATRLRKEYGLDVAQVVLGHKTLAVTQVYAEKDVESASKVMMEIG